MRPHYNPALISIICTPPRASRTDCRVLVNDLELSGRERAQEVERSHSLDRRASACPFGRGHTSQTRHTIYL